MWTCSFCIVGVECAVLGCVHGKEAKSLREWSELHLCNDQLQALGRELKKLESEGWTHSMTRQETCTVFHVKCPCPTSAVLREADEVEVEEEEEPAVVVDPLAGKPAWVVERIRMGNAIQKKYGFLS